MRTTFQRMSTTEPGDGRHSDMETKMTNPAPTTEPGDGRHSDMETKMTNPAPTTEPGDGRHSDMETKMTNPAPTTEPGDGRHSDMETKMTNPAPTTEPGDGPHSDISNPTLPGTSINWDNISYRELKAMARSCSITIPPGLNKNLLKTFVKADKEGHNEYLRLLVNEVLAKQSRLKKRLREKRSNKPVVKIVKNKVQGGVDPVVWRFELLNEQAKLTKPCSS
ncbi:hypothetical protein J6590_074201 [Homalodisca vitripennis]|nr:hypothetical protein J6590_074201 [Homalodisca vitripennis]